MPVHKDHKMPKGMPPKGMPPKGMPMLPAAASPKAQEALDKSRPVGMPKKPAKRGAR